MNFKLVVNFCIIVFVFCCGCKKEYDYNVEYKVTLTPFVGQTDYSTSVEYIVKDNVLKKEKINSTQWVYNFKGKVDDSAYLKIVNLSNASSVRVDMIINQSSFFNVCNTNNCEIELRKPLD